MSFDYRVLTEADRSKLRFERIRSLEAEIYRAELQLDDAQSSAERESVLADIELIRQRLEPHYAAAGLGQSNGEVVEGGAQSAGEPVPVGELRPAE